ncbi:hypothetical protein [Stenotrophomonas sp. PFBMAA-4]|uniref:hypothetical protein n=1 Tax=Stenotrophomonas sp. PFBMAA-4 TaxID=3043301 RepID=UPI0024B62602|nr:hypothetical protein [Stenotrophomonas sp. PFBMAA-4]MDI9273136.1 hypothetical protein [Stenotrophomonas sp. PFBMAA-4]
MALKDELLHAIRNDPLAVRELISSADTDAALGSIGILPKVLELHAPSVKSKKRAGLGETLCGIRGTLHSVVTCKRCLKKLDDDLAG